MNNAVIKGLINKADFDQINIDQKTFNLSFGLIPNSFQYEFEK